MKTNKQVQKELEFQREFLNKAESKEERIQYEWIINTLEWVLEM